MFDAAEIGWILGIQGIILSLVTAVLWGIAFHRLRYGAIGLFMAAFPLIGIVATTFVSMLLGLMPFFGIDPFLLYNVVPSLVSFLFGISPLVFLVIRLGRDRDDEVFE